MHAIKNVKVYSIVLKVSLQISMKIYSKQRLSRGQDLVDRRSAAQSFGPSCQAWGVLPGDSVRLSISCRPVIQDVPGGMHKTSGECSLC